MQREKDKEIRCQATLQLKSEIHVRCSSEHLKHGEERKKKKDLKLKRKDKLGGSHSSFEGQTRS